MANPVNAVSSVRISIAQAAAATAVTFAALFVACWVGALVPDFGATHAYIALFTSAPVASTAALAQGVCWSFLFGAVAGGALAFFLNAFSPLARRQV